MATATQTFLGFEPGGVNWGSTSFDGVDAFRGTTEGESGPTAVYLAGIFTSRGFFELDMAALVGDGYVPGSPISSAVLAFEANSGNASVRLVVDDTAALADSDVSLFGKLGPSEAAWSGDTAISSSGAKTIDLNATAFSAIAALDGTDKRVIGFCLADEATDGNAVEVSPYANATLTVTFEPAGSSGPANLKSCSGVAKASIKKICGVDLANIKSVSGVV